MNSPFKVDGGHGSYLEHAYAIVVGLIKCGLKL